jgi:hypothetical protein
MSRVAAVDHTANEAKSEQRNKTMPAISTGCDTRPIGVLAMKCVLIFGSSNHAFVIAVFTSPGARALTRIP